MAWAWLSGALSSSPASRRRTLSAGARPASRRYGLFRGGVPCAGWPAIMSETIGNGRFSLPWTERSAAMRCGRAGWGRPDLPSRGTRPPWRAGSDGKASISSAKPPGRELLPPPLRAPFSRWGTGGRGRSSYGPFPAPFPESGTGNTERRPAWPSIRTTGRSRPPGPSMRPSSPFPARILRGNN